MHPGYASGFLRSPEKYVPWFLALVLTGQAIFLGCFMGAFAGAADSSGYMNLARMLTRREYSTSVRPIAGVDEKTLPGYSDHIYAPLGFRPLTTPGRISGIYPAGFPFIIKSVATVTGWGSAAGLTMGIHAILGVLLVYVLGRESGLSPGWSAMGALMLGVSPLYHFMSLETMSDVPALVWTTGGILCAWRAQRHPAWALAAGFIVGFAVLIRPTNALILLPAAIAVGRNVPRLIVFALGGIPVVVALACYNSAAYGKIFTTGYFNSPDSFALHRVDSTFLHYAAWLPVLLTPLVVAALALPWTRGLTRRWKWILGSWVVVFLGFYSTYVFTHMAWWFLRFVLPAFPPLIVAALHGLRGFSGRKPGRVSPPVAWLAVAGIIFIHGAVWTRVLRGYKSGADERNYRETASWLQANLPPQAIICTMQNSGALFYYTDFTLLRWDAIAPDQFRVIADVARAAGRPLYATLMNYEVDDAGAFQKHMPGRWEVVGRVRAFTVWKFVFPP